MARLTAIERESLPEDERRFYDAVRWIRRSPITGPFIVTMNSSPDLAARIAHLGHYFHARGQGDESILPMRVRGFVSVIGSRALDAPYEWSAWVNWALEAGVAQATVDEVREGRPPRNLTAEDTLVADFCMQSISGNHRVAADTFRAALDHFGLQGRRCSPSAHRQFGAAFGRPIPCAHRRQVHHLSRSLDDRYRSYAFSRIVAMQSGYRHSRGRRAMSGIHARLKIAALTIGIAAGWPAPANAQGIVTVQKLSAPLANELVGESVAICAQKGYTVTAIVVDLDGVRQALLRGNGAAIHTLDNAYYKAYSAASLTLGRKEDSTRAVAARMAKNAPSTVPQTPLPNVTYATGGIAVMVGGTTIGGLGISGAPGGQFDEECGKAALAKIADRMK